jgi:predicted metal-binding membrane protein
MTGPASQRVFVAVTAVVLAAGTAATVAGSAAMSAMGALPVAGGWLMPMVWTPMCGRGWPDVAAGFLGMWAAMTTAMMAPAAAAMLWRYRLAAGEAEKAHPRRLTVVVGLGYGLVWAAIGVAVFALGAGVAAAMLRAPALARAAPLAAGTTVLIAGVLQFSAWKARLLACCREAPACCGDRSWSMSGAWRHGLRMGLRCGLCCAGPTAVLLVLGAMDLAVMAAVTVAITAERLAPNGTRAAHAAGALAIGAGLWMIARAAAFG